MVSAPIDALLRIEVALEQTYEILDTQLPWLNPSFGRFCSRIQENSDAFTYLKDVYNKATDPKRKLPTQRVAGTRLPELDRTRRTLNSAVLTEKGFSLRIPKELLKSVPLAQTEIQENYEYAAYAFAYMANKDMCTAIKNGANQAGTYFSPNETWANTGGTADPIRDLMALAHDMDVDGYEGTLTDAWVLKPDWYNLQNYLKDVHVDAAKQAMLGQPTIHDDIMTIPIVGDVHKVPTIDSGLNQGDIIGMDRNHPGVEYHYRLDPEYSTFTINYWTRGPDGGMVPAVTDNFGFHYRWYQEEESLDIVQCFWMESVTIVKKPYNLIYGTGI